PMTKSRFEKCGIGIRKVLLGLIKGLLISIMFRFNKDSFRITESSEFFHLKSAFSKGLQKSILNLSVYKGRIRSEKQFVWALQSQFETRFSQRFLHKNKGL